eukprot:212272-Prymnesium_polylepis.1
MQKHSEGSPFIPHTPADRNPAWFNHPRQEQPGGYVSMRGRAPAPSAAVHTLCASAVPVDP